MNKKILVSTSGGIPNKYIGASTRLFFQYIKGLLNNNFEVVHCVITDDESKVENDINDYLAQLNSSNISIQIINIGMDYISIINELQFDLILCFDISSAEYFETYRNKRKILWLGDLSYIVGFYHFYYDVKNNPIKIITAPLVSLRLLKRLFLYKKYCQLFDLIIVSSYSSIKRLEFLKINNEIKYLAYPWLLDKSKNLENKKKFQIPTFLFLGTLSALGSKSAFDFISGKLYSKLVEKFGQNKFKILIAGSNNIPEWFISFSQDKKELEHVGFVDDLDCLMQKCHGAIVPIDIPIGNRSRIVTCFGLKIPVIAHQNTALGNPLLKHNYNCFLTDNAEEFSQYMDDIYNKIPKKLLENAYNSYLQSFEPEYAIGQLIKEIELIDE